MGIERGWRGGLKPCSPPLAGRFRLLEVLTKRFPVELPPSLANVRDLVSRDAFLDEGEDRSLPCGLQRDADRGLDTLGPIAGAPGESDLLRGSENEHAALGIPVVGGELPADPGLDPSRAPREGGVPAGLGERGVQGSRRRVEADCLADGARRFRCARHGGPVTRGSPRGRYLYRPRSRAGRGTRSLARIRHQPSKLGIGGSNPPASVPRNRSLGRQGLIGARRSGPGGHRRRQSSRGGVSAAEWKGRTVAATSRHSWAGSAPPVASSLRDLPTPPPREVCPLRPSAPP